MQKLLPIIIGLEFMVLLYFASGTGSGSLMIRVAAQRQVAKLTQNLALKPKPTVDLKVPLHRQEHALSCEIAALQSALAFKGVRVTESELIAQLAFDRTPKKDGIWGDPSKGFVGNIDGKMPSTGYGVYWPPIADLGSIYRPVEGFTGGTLERLLVELDAGNPIVIWVYLGSGTNMAWRTANGETIKAVLSEHARTVTGYSGPRNKPTGIYTVDPLYGRMYYPISAFMANWGRLGNSGVVIR